MSQKVNTQQIIKELVTLPDDRIIEVIDFVQFLKSKVKKQGISLQNAGLSKAEAIDLRARLAVFENDWNARGMEAYDEL